MASLFYFYTVHIKNVIFDFGGVLIDVDYHKTIDAFKSMGIANFEKLYSQADQEHLFDHYETGQISSQYFINQLISKTDGMVTANKIVNAWNAMLGEIHAANVESVEQLKEKGYNVYLLSNTNDIHIQVAFDRWNRLPLVKPKELFDGIFLSQEIGMRKPNKDIFEHVLREISALPEEVLFIDDSVQHIRTAEQLGISTHLLNKINDLSGFLLTKFH